jgi:FMN reductase [NAD(P)H]
LPLNGIIHNDTYKDYSEEDINSIYAYKESLPENLHFVEINKKENLAQVFTDCRYTKTDNESMSKGLIEALKQQGFL